MDRVEKVALEIRRDRIARTTRTGGAFDPDVPPTESEIAAARAAIAVIEADVREECAKIADDHAEAIDAMPSSDAVDDAGRKMAALIAHAIRRAGNA